MARLAIRMPKMSMTMTEGEVGEWLVSVGDEVAVGDVVCEVMTDKVDMEVESSVAGRLVEIVVATGMADVGAPIGWVEGEDDGGGFGDLLAESAPAPAEPEPADRAGTAAAPDHPAPAATPTPVDAAPLPPEPPPPSATVGPVAAVPRARALAREHGIDLARVAGSGPEGLVRVADVEALVPRPPTPSTTRRAAARAAVARAMEPSALVPQFTVWRELTLDRADARRQGISWTTVMLRAYAAALRTVPELLCRWEGGRAVEAGPPGVALAVATDRGLMAPVFQEPDRADPVALDAEVREVVRSAHAGRLAASYLGAANATLSNLGGFGADRFQALLTPPQASVLALGSIRPRPVAVPGGVGLALTVQAGLTVDHRGADGAHAARLLSALAEGLDAAEPAESS